MIDFSIQKDIANARAYLRAGRCIILAPGVRITLTKRASFESQIVYRGQKLWTVNEAFRKQ